MRKFIRGSLLARLPYAGFLAWMSIAGFNSECSAPYFMIQVDGWTGKLAMGASVVLCLSLVADAVTNVFHVNPPVLKWTHRYRYVLFLAGALCFLIPPYSYTRMLTSNWGTIALYGLLFVWSIGLAIDDGMEKRSELQCAA